MHTITMKAMRAAVTAAAGLLLFACQTTSGGEFSVDGGEQKELTYSIDNQQVTFVLDQDFSGQAALAEQVDVRGSFNDWDYHEDWEMQRDGERWVLEKPLSEVMVPGNLGVPEYKFVVDDNNWVGADRLYPQDYQLSGNMLIVPEGVSFEELDRKREMAKNMRTEYDSDAQMANFREVRAGELGEGRLYRGYNPMIASKTEHPREDDRVAMAAQLIEQNQIEAVINLSETEEQVSRMDVFAYYRDLVEDDKVLFTATSYATAYWNSDSAEFAQTIDDVFRFIAAQADADDPAESFYAHCRLGTDRTGVVVAVLAGFMRGSWPEIRQDYLQSNELGIREYRDEELLRYAMGNMLDTEVDDETELKPLIDRYLQEQVGLDDDILEKAYTVLQ